MKAFKVLAIVLLATFSFSAANAQMHHEKHWKKHHRHHMMRHHHDKM